MGCCSNRTSHGELSMGTAGSSASLDEPNVAPNRAITPLMVRGTADDSAGRELLTSRLARCRGGFTFRCRGRRATVLRPSRRRLRRAHHGPSGSVGSSCAGCSEGCWIRQRPIAGCWLWNGTPCGRTDRAWARRRPPGRFGGSAADRPQALPGRTRPGVRPVCARLDWTVRCRSCSGRAQRSGDGPRASPCPSGLRRTDACRWCFGARRSGGRDVPAPCRRSVAFQACRPAGRLASAIRQSTHMERRAHRCGGTL